MQRSLEFYGDLLGLAQVKRNKTAAGLSSTGKTPYVLIIEEAEGAKPKPRASTGLFHIALRLPNRTSLAKTLVRLLESGWPLQGASDHAVSEAIYLADPDGNGVELYCDRPEDEWPRANAQIEMTTGRLDIDNLLATIQSADETKDRSNGGGTDLGHIHLQGSDLAKARHFYHETLGMDVMQENYPGALFMAAGGYHHHLGVNTWNSAGGAPAAADTVGLASFALQIPDEGNWYVLQERLNERGHKPIKARDYGYATGVQYSDPDENLVELFIDKAALSGKTGTNLEVEIVL